MNTENSTAGKNEPEAAPPGAAPANSSGKTTTVQTNNVSAHTPLGLLLGGAAVVLALMVTLLTLISIDRSEAAMARLLAEKGSSLIIAFESILRSGMRSEAGVRLQVLLEEMAESPGIVFVAVTMPDGTIVAHSNPARLGEILQVGGREADDMTMRELAPDMLPHWGIMRMEGRRVFTVYRLFSPGMHDLPRGFPMPVIFLGLDLSPFEITRSQNRDYVAMLAAVTLLVGLACLVALYYAERARESRQRQRMAEGKVRRLEEEVRRDSVERAGGNEYAESPLNPKVFFTSAVTGKGVDALMKATGARVAELREAQRKAMEGQEHFDQIWQHRRDAKDKKFKVTKLSEGVFRVVGTQVERMVVQCDWENEEAVVFLQHRLKRVGVEEALEKAGAVDGDEIRICGRAFEFESTRTAADLFEELDI